MFIKTAAWGSMEISEEQVYHFPKGIPGFQEELDFALIDLEEGQFAQLQSLQTAELAFLLADPFVFYPQYEFDLPQNDMDELQIKDSVVIRSIVTIKNPLDQSTLNLLAPVVLNPDTRMGKQVVLHKSAYQSRHLLWGETHNELERGGE
ncbi:MAG: flagellar assembly protein FliW [Paenibacillus sp.]|nr:flagellar assembly protein FliW [Paenibacillus sp.]